MPTEPAQKGQALPRRLPYTSAYSKATGRQVKRRRMVADKEEIGWDDPGLRQHVQLRVAV